MDKVGINRAGREKIYDLQISSGEIKYKTRSMSGSLTSEDWRRNPNIKATVNHWSIKVGLVKE